MCQVAAERNSGVSAKAFVFDELKSALGVEKVIDLDAAPTRAPSEAERARRQ